MSKSYGVFYYWFNICLSFPRDSSDNDTPRRRVPPPPPPPQLRGRSASADRRRGERVTFEDEIQSRPTDYRRSGSYQDLRDPYSNFLQMSDSDTETGSKRRNVKTVHNRFHSDQDLRGYNSGKIEGQRRLPLKLGKHKKLNTALSTEDLAAAAVSTGNEDSSSHAVHRANPVVVLPPKPVKPPRRSKASKAKKKLETQVSTESLLATIPPPVSPGRLGPGDMDITSEVSFGSTNNGMEDINFDTPKHKKSKLPWKKNKGRYTPNEELERIKLNILQSNSRSPSWNSLYSESMGSVGNLSVESSGRKKKQKSKTKTGNFDHNIPKSYTPDTEEDNRPVPAVRQSKRSASESPRTSDSPYEQVEFSGPKAQPVENSYEPVDFPRKPSPRTTSGAQKKSRLSNPYEDIDDFRPTVCKSKSPRNSRGYETVELSPSRSLKSPQSSQDLSSVRRSAVRQSIDFENPYEDVMTIVRNEAGHEDIVTRENEVRGRRSGEQANKSGHYDDVDDESSPIFDDTTPVTDIDQGKRSNFNRNNIQGSKLTFFASCPLANKIIF